MKANRSPNTVVCSGVEELDEAVQALGWNVEYRQLGMGVFHAEIGALECNRSVLTTARFDNRLDILGEPPEGYTGICFPRFSQGQALACGQLLTDGDVIMFQPGTVLEFLTIGAIRCETLLLPQTQFLSAVRSLTPAQDISQAGVAAILSCSSAAVAKVLRDVDSLQQTGILQTERASMLLAKIILLLSDYSSKTGAEILFSDAVTTIARRAQDYIEHHFRDVILLEDLCAYTGVGLRTLQRCFAHYFQISPLHYVKARRLNEARRELAIADPSTDRVTNIAMKNGFFHLGRFSVDYRSHFGESPSETLAATKLDRRKYVSQMRMN
jgi:AraC-like DNA-binding protein